MGLFGYNEKNYNKNSGDFKERLDNIMTSLMERGLNTLGVGKCITNLELMIDRLKYTKGKDLERVDKEIDKLISAMEDDAMKKRISSVLMRADLLHRELDESRRYGKNAFTDAERQAENARADSLGHIHDALNELDVIEKRQKKLIDAAASVSESEQQKYELEYNALEKDKASLKRTVQMWTSRYNTATEVISSRKTAGQIGELEMTQVGDLKSFEKEMAEAGKKLEKQIAIDGEFVEVGQGFGSNIDEILGTGAVNQSSGFNAAVEDRRNEKAMEDAGPAGAYQGQVTEELSPFQKAKRESGLN